ncbi:Asparagine--tRNA ligase, cytoplasmic 1 [Linum perenne]
MLFSDSKHISLQFSDQTHVVTLAKSGNFAHLIDLNLSPPVSVSVSLPLIRRHSNGEFLTQPPEKFPRFQSPKSIGRNPSIHPHFGLADSLQTSNSPQVLYRSHSSSDCRYITSQFLVASFHRSCSTDHSLVFVKVPDTCAVILYLFASTLVKIVGHVVASDRRLEDSKKRIEELEKKLVGDLQADIRKLNDELSAGDGKIIVPEEEVRVLGVKVEAEEAEVKVKEAYVNDKCYDDMEMMAKFYDKGCIHRLRMVSTAPFERISYQMASVSSGVSEVIVGTNKSTVYER